MVAVIDNNLAAIERLCRNHHVERLELFGSAAKGEFDSAHSDLDFVVHFKPLPPSQRADAYFDLLASLQDLFLREVDLVEIEAIKNPYFLQSLETSRQVLYAA